VPSHAPNELFETNVSIVKENLTKNPLIFIKLIPYHNNIFIEDQTIQATFGCITKGLFFSGASIPASLTLC
jgi:hypothetical protein